MFELTSAKVLCYFCEEVIEFGFPSDEWCASVGVEKNTFTPEWVHLDGAVPCKTVATPSNIEFKR